MSYQNEDGIECGGCEFRHTRADTALGHTQCSIHRPCTGLKYWEPFNFTACMEQEKVLKNMNGPDRLAHLGKKSPS